MSCFDPYGTLFVAAYVDERHRESNYSPGAFYHMKTNKTLCIMGKATASAESKTSAKHGESGGPCVSR